MSTLTYLTSLVQQAISRLNNYEANAKKVDELPHQTTLEPTSKIPVSRAGISEHLTVQQIISSIQNSNYNQLLAVGTITVDGTDITVPSGVSGQINGLLYGTSTDTILSITLCPTGFSRKDIIVLTTANTVVVISGEETDEAIVLAPPVPTDAVYITEFDVNDSSIGIPVDPIVGNRFVEKTDFNPYNSNVTGTDAIIPLDPNGYSEIRLTNTGLVSIAGYDLSLITGNASAKSPYPGKPFVILNITGHDVVIKKELPAADYPFYFSEESDLVFPNNHYIYASFDPSGFRVIFKSWVDLSTKLDKSTTLSSVYGTDVSGNQAMIPLSDFGTVKGTGTTNRISKFGLNDTIVDSQVFDNGTSVGINTNTPSSDNRLEVNGRTFISAGVEGGNIAPLVVRNTIPYQSPFNQFLQVWQNSAANSITTLRSDGTFSTASSVSGAVLISTSPGTLSSVAFRTSSSGNTGMYFPITNVVGLVTNGVERMRILPTGEIAIGAPTAGARLDVRAQGALATDIVFRVRNSVDTANLLSVNGQGTLSLGLQASAPTGIEGAIYYNSTDKKHYGFNGTTWNALY